MVLFTVGLDGQVLLSTILLYVYIDIYIEVWVAFKSYREMKPLMSLMHCRGPYSNLY